MHNSKKAQKQNFYPIPTSILLHREKETWEVDCSGVNRMISELAPSPFEPGAQASCCFRLLIFIVLKIATSLSPEEYLWKEWHYIIRWSWLVGDTVLALQTGASLSAWGVSVRCNVKTRQHPKPQNLDLNLEPNVPKFAGESRVCIQMHLKPKHGISSLSTVHKRLCYFRDIYHSLRATL